MVRIDFTSLVVAWTAWCVLVGAAESPGGGHDFWAYQPPRKTAPQVPQDTGWVRGDIDRFILSGLERAGLRPAPDADRATLARRLYFDLIGLPPTVEQLDEFLNDRSPAAFETLVDRLLSSSHFGERWGRHWLDVARYADSSGGGRSLIFLNAWRYRDYVIDSFNRDKPFDQFICEQIAGDLLPAAHDDERAERLIATAFLMIGAHNYELQDKDQLRMDVVDEQIEAVGRAFLGQTLGCARCHDHKFDPIPTTDYYALAGIFRSTKSLTPGNVSGFEQHELPVAPEHRAALDAHAAAVKNVQAQLDQAKAELKKVQPDGKTASAKNAMDKDNPESKQDSAKGDVKEPHNFQGDASPSAAEVTRQIQELESQVKQFEAELKKLKDSAPTPAPLTMGVKDEKDVCDFRVCVRGIVHNLAEEVHRGFLTVASELGGEQPVIAEGESGRRELADWLTSTSNPLTARVTVNRIWHHLFGVGLVRTADNFGSTGELPSHLELLDWLAIRFRELGWSQKKVIREIVLSRAYQMSSRPDISVDEVAVTSATGGSQSGAEMAAGAADPGNRLLARQNRRRLDAECLRDAILLTSGQLDLTPGGPTIRDKTDSEVGYQFDLRRRSVYLPVFRNNLPDILEVFDFANPNTPTSAREVSTLPAQALYLMNSPFVMDAARKAAEDILELDLSDSDRINVAYRRTLGRHPTPTEHRLALDYVQNFKAERATDQISLRLKAWSRFYQILFASVDFRYLH